MKFKELDLKDELLEAIDYMGFEDCTEIQEQAIPKILANKDLIACAQTGTGKTVAFVLPILNKLVGKQDSSINTLIICPTRELAVQIEQEIQGLSYFVSVSSIAIYGGGSGSDWDEQKQALSDGCDIIVATPGKLLSHLKMGYVKFDQLEHLILDEADKMLDMGFINDLNAIFNYLPESKQTLLFSATMPPKIIQLAKKICKQPDQISLSISKPAEGVSQFVYLTHNEQKIGTIDHILKERPDYDSIIIFTSTKSNVSDIVKALRKKGYKASGISSNLEQEEREEVLRKFRARRVRILVATDVMSRGIDIKEINMVINYACPRDAEDYVHRIGRTARANTKGEAFTLVNEEDLKRIQKIQRLIEMEIPRLDLPEELGQGPEWREIQPRNNKKRFYGKKGKGKKPFHKNHKPKPNGQ
ncbi:MAG: DEAD/DEAH box helicase [Crocinitomicaceae bacterium]|nr:DEAD/DEAH box helicase [Crocinitomicaceae bacterium]